MILNKACLLFLGLGLCLSSGFAENTGYKESWIGEKTNFEISSNRLIDPYVRCLCNKVLDQSQGEATRQEYTSDDPFYISVLNGGMIPLKSEQDPQNNSVVYLPRETDDGKTGGEHFLTRLPVQDGKDVDVSGDLAQWKQDFPFLILSFGDAHMPGSDFVMQKGEELNSFVILNRLSSVKREDLEGFVKHRYEKYCKAVKELLQGYPKPVLFLVCGDGLPRWPAEMFPNFSGYSSLFAQFLLQLQGVLPQGSQVIYSLGNHDVQSQQQFDEFMDALDDLEQRTAQHPEKKIHILTNTPSLWHNGNLQNRFNTVGYIHNNVGVVSYFTNMALGCGGGIVLDAKENEKNQGRPSVQQKFLQYCQDFFHDGNRAGYPDILFGSPLYGGIGNNEHIDIDDSDDSMDGSEEGDDEASNFRQKVGFLGDRSVLNPVSEETADVFFGVLNKLAQDNPDPTPLTMVVMAHDYYLKPMIFYEMMSRFVEKYQMDPGVLKRLNIVICAGHEHSTYSGKQELYLQGNDGCMYAIPCSFGGAGIYLEGINVFAGNPGGMPLIEGNGKWITMDARDYNKYNEWLEKTFGYKAGGQDHRFDKENGYFYRLLNDSEKVPSEYQLPVARENDGVLILTSEKVQ